MEWHPAACLPFLLLKRKYYFGQMKFSHLLLVLFLPLSSLCQSGDSLRFEKASNQYDSEKYEGALKEVNHLIERDHNQAKYFSLRGQINYKINKRTQSIDDFTKAISLEPSNPLHYHYRAIVFYSVQEPDYAIEDNNTALGLVAANDSLHYSLVLNRGNAYAMKRDFQKAYLDYFDVLKFDSTHQGALTNIGAVLD